MEKKLTYHFQRTGIKKKKLSYCKCHSIVHLRRFIFMSVCEHMFIQLNTATLPNSALSLFPTHCFGPNQLRVNNKYWCKEEKIGRSFLGLPIILYF